MTLKEQFRRNLFFGLNYALNGKFPSKLKMADVIPILKKDDPFEKANYRPISLLPPLSKVYEKLIYQQLNTFFEINYLIFYVVSVQGIVLSMHY